VARVTIAGGFAKMTKFAQGRLDLHSGRSQVDFEWLGERITEAGGGDMADMARRANTALEVREEARAKKIDIAGVVAEQARKVALATLRGAQIKVDIVIVDRHGEVIARAG